MYKGIDVSQWQGVIDWAKVKGAGIEFAIIRALRGSLETDPQFETNFTGARNHGIAVGVYKYSYATTVDFAKAEAEAVIKLLAGRQLEAKIWFDMEDECQRTLDKSLLYQIVKTFIDTISAAGYQVGIYCNTYWYNSILTDEIRNLTNNWWLAQWGDNKPSFGLELTGWQYSSKGKINGIGGNVDLDNYYVKFDSITGTSSSSAATPAAPVALSKFKKGDVVKVKNAVQYDNGQAFKCWYETYEVISVSGDRVVIGKGSTITAAVSEKNIILASDASNTAVNTEIKPGDTVKVTNAVQYDNGQAFKCWYDTFEVIAVSGDRIVIGKGAVKTAAVHRDNLQKV